MNRLIKTIGAAALAAVCAVFAGCSGNGEQTPSTTSAEVNAETTAQTTTAPVGKTEKFFDISYTEPEHTSVEDKEVDDESGKYTVRGYTCDGYMITLTYVKNSKVEDWIENSEAYLEEDFSNATFMTYYDGTYGFAFMQNGKDVYSVRCIINGGETSEKMEQAFSDILHSVKITAQS